MNPEKFALAVGAAVFVGGSLGLILHRVLPEKHVTGGAKDMIGAVVGLLTLLSALVLGLLIWTAYGVYAGQSVAIQTLAAKVLQLDLALADASACACPSVAGRRAASTLSLARRLWMAAAKLLAAKSALLMCPPQISSMVLPRPSRSCSRASFASGP